MSGAITTHIHSFSLRFHLRHGVWDVFRYIQQMAAAGFDGINLSANGPGLRDLGGTTPQHFAAVRAACRAAGLALELDTSDTRPDHMRAMLAVAAACGADTLRTYTRYQGDLEDLIAWTVRDLTAIADDAAAAGVTVVLENHEDFQGDAIARILGAVAHPQIRALYDYGNSQMVGEDPVTALEAMAPFIHCVHIKDHVLVRDRQRPDQLWVQGVAMGDGTLPIVDLSQRLYALGLRRFCFENVWAYRAPLTPVAGQPLPSTPCFQIRQDHAALSGEDLPLAARLEGEAEALIRGLAWFRRSHRAAGFQARLFTRDHLPAFASA